jgi:PAS domain S-box-containing protein
MRIKTQFIITMSLFGIILIVIATSAIVTSRQVEKASEQEKIASSIAQGASELSYLSNDYLIYRESQQLKRWQSSFALFSTEVASLRAVRPDQQVLVANVKANQQRLKEVFDSVASAVGGSSQNRSAPLDLAFLQVSWSRMAVQSQGLVSDASRLSQLLHQQMDQITKTRTMLMYVMVGLFGAFLLASYLLTYRHILKSIVALQAGVAVIGSGNLDFVIEEKKNDEIGDLSRGFNQMTVNLKAVTASKADLEREVTQRKRAEEDLRRQREWLRVTLSSIGDAVIASDTEGRITFLNPVAVMVTGWELEEALGQPIQDVFRIINEKTHAPAGDLVARVLNDKRVIGLANDTALVTKDGREVPIEDSAAPIKDSAGDLIGVVLVFHDVSEKRHAQRVLLEAHERAAWLARFPDENPNPVLRVSADGTMLYCNSASAEIIGWGCEVGKLLQDPLLPLVEQAMTKAEEATQDMELGGRSYSVSVTPFPAERYANVYGRDITERIRAEEALRGRTFELQRLTETLEQRVQERAVDLGRANEALRHLSSRLMSAQEEERKRIAGEIHDSLGSCLSGIKFKVEKTLQEVEKTPHAMAESLNAVIPVIQEGIEECRRMQQDLRPSLLDDLGLLATLSWFCRRYQTIYTGIKVDLEQTLEEKDIPNALKIVIYRVTQEGMNNIAKHSKADLVHLSLRKMDGKIELVLEDNGQGFDLTKMLGSESTRRGLGLTSMRERAEVSGGSFAIESVEGKGTTIRASWPLSRND